MKDRRMKVLNKFISSDVPITVNTLSKEFRVSSRTLRNDISEINSYLAKENFPLIENIRGNGSFLKLNNNQKKTLRDIAEDRDLPVYFSKEERIFDLILSFSLSNKKTFLYKKEEEYFVSKSTMDEDIKQVRLILEDYGIKVLSIPKQGIILQGKERSVRTMLCDVVNRFVGYMDYSEHLKSEKILYKYIPKETFIQIDEIYDNSISAIEENIYRNQIIIFTAVWLGRYLRQDTLANVSQKSAYVTKSDIGKFVYAVYTDFGISPAETEIKYIICMIETFNSRNMNNSLDWVQAQLFSIQIIQHVEKETKIPFSRKEEKLQEGLYKHLTGLIGRLKNDIQLLNPLRENIEYNYNDIYNAVSSFSPIIEKSTGKRLSEDEAAFLTIHFSTYVYEINQERKYVYRGVVICNHGIATGKLLSENLKELFNIKILAVLSSKELDVIEKLDADIVFSTVDINYENKPVLVLDPIIKKENRTLIEDFLEKNKDSKKRVSDYIDSTNFFYSIINIIEESGGRLSKEIYQKLEKVFDHNHLEINKREIQPMLKDLMKDKDILLNEPAQDWRDAIKKVSVPLLKEGVIEERYVDAMINSVEVNGAYIVIGKNLALAHARPEEGVNELGISVATLETPIEFGNEDNDPVKIIFCLAAIDSYSHLNIMKNLVDLINDQNKIDQLIECTKIDDFKEILYNKIIQK